MTDTTATPASQPEIADADLDRPSATLERQADALLDEDHSFAPPLRQALRRDAQAARDWSQERARDLRSSVEAEPIRATAYALGIGVVLGMLLRR